jgi:acyl transferase domain-containing protein
LRLYHDCFGASNILLIVPFQEKGLKVPIHATPWPSDRAERISINSFGIGGSNAHVILDSAAAYHINELEARDTAIQKTSELLVFSGNTQASLQRLIERYKEYLAAHPERLSDLSYTLALRREHLPHRAFAVVSDSFIVNPSQFTKVPSTSSHMTMIFSGQGAQWPQMGKQLIKDDPDFRKDIADMNDVLHGLEQFPPWDIESK